MQIELTDEEIGTLEDALRALERENYDAGRDKDRAAMVRNFTLLRAKLLEDRTSDRDAR